MSIIPENELTKLIEAAPIDMEVTFAMKKLKNGFISSKRFVCFLCPLLAGYSNI